MKSAAVLLLWIAELVLPTRGDFGHAVVSSVARQLVSKLMQETDVPNMLLKDEPVSHRHLGDFDRFNRLFEGAQIALPDTEVRQWIVFADLVIKVSGLYCTDIVIGDVSISHTKVSDQRIAATAVIEGLDLNCYGNYRSDYGAIGGDGTLVAYTANNRIEIDIDLRSDDFDLEPPSVAAVVECAAAIDVVNLDMSGSALATIATVAEGIVSGIIEDKVNGVACDQLKALGPTLMADGLAKVREQLEGYMDSQPADRLDPWYPERNMQIPNGVSLLNLRATGNSIGGLLSMALVQVDKMLSEEVEDLGGPAGNDTDLAINVMLRKNMLDGDRCLALVLEDLAVNRTLFATHDRLTETAITLEGVKVCGLDTITTVSVLQPNSNFTVRNAARWEYLRFQLDATVNIKVSSQPDAVLSDPNPTDLVENITIELGVEDLNVGMSMLMAVDEDLLLDLELGSLLRSENMFACILSSIHRMEVSLLDVSVASIPDPIMKGFVSVGLDQMVSALVKIAFDAYEPSLLRSVRGLFNGRVRDFLNDSFFGNMLTETAACPPALVNDSYIDLRDLLLLPNRSLALGGSGEEPYGDLGHVLFDAFRTQLAVVGHDGLLRANEMLVRPMTLSQSGEEGVVRFPSDLAALARDLPLSFGQSSASHFELKLSDARIENLDTLVAPLAIMEPTDELFSAENIVTAGTGGSEKLGVTIRLYIAMEAGVGSVLNMLNDIDITASVDALEILAGLQVMLKSSGFLGLPLRHALSMDCWLAMFPILEDGEVGLAFESFVTDLSTLSFDTKCSACSSKGFVVLPDLLGILDESKAIFLLGHRLTAFVSSLLKNGSSEGVLGQLVAEGHLLCPVSDSYDESAVRSESGHSFAQMSTESIDTLLYAAILVSEVAFVVFTESHRMSPLGHVTALDAETAKIPSEARLLDWTNIGNSLGFGNAVDQAFEQARAFISGKDGLGTLRINALLDEYVLDDGKLTLGPDATYSLGDLEITVESVAVTGLSSFSLFDPMVPIAPRRLRNNLALDKLGLSVALTVSSLASSAAPQKVTVSFDVADVTAQVDVLAAVDLDKIGGLEIGSLLHSKNILPCVLSTAAALEATSFIVEVGAFSSPVIDGLLNETDAAVSAVQAALREQFGDKIREALPTILETTVKELFNGFLGSFVSGNRCPKAAFSANGQGLVDFWVMFGFHSSSSLYGDVPRLLKGLLDSLLLQIDPATGLASINERLIRGVTEGQSGVSGLLSFPGDLFNQGTHISVGGLDANVELRAFEAYVDNVDSIGEPLSLLEPLESARRVLNNTAAVGVGHPVQIGFRFAFALKDDDSEIRNDLAVRLDMRSLSVVLAAFLHVTEQAVANFPLKDILNPHCWMATMPAPSLDARGVRRSDAESSLGIADLRATVSQLNLSISCVECSSPGVAELTELLATPEAVDGATAVGNKVLDLAMTLLSGPFLQVRIDRMVNEAPHKCPSHPSYDPDFEAGEYASVSDSLNGDSAVTILIALGIAVACLVFGVSAVVLAVKFVVRRRNKQWLNDLPYDKKMVLWHQQSGERDKDRHLNSTTRSMFQSPEIPVWIRLFVPFVIVGNIGLFLSGHLSLGATVNIVVQFAGDEFIVSNFFEFSMARSTVEIWEAGGKELAIMILLFSGVWPYSKQLITFALWFLPPGRVSVRKRGTVLEWLDALAKWSMVDIFVLVVTVAGFRVSVQSPDVPFLPDGFYTLDLLVIPMWGLYANFIAQLVSQISSHFILHYHRRIISYAHDRFDQGSEDGSKDASMDCPGHLSADDASTTLPPPIPARSSDGAVSLCRHSFARPHRGESDRLVVRKIVLPVLWFVSITLTIMVVLGCTLPSISLETLGIVGVLVESGQQFREATSKYSLFTIIELFFEQADFTGRMADYVGLGSLSALLVLSVLLVPIAQTACLLYQWMVPLREKTRVRLALAVEIMQAWQYAEVFLLAVVIASWQLGPVSDFMINEYCAGLEDTFAELVFFGLLDERDAQCFRVETSLDTGSYLLLAGAILLAALNTFVMNATAQYIRDRDSSVEEERAHRRAASKIDSDAELDDSNIVPSPVLFTDKFRWLLARENAMEDRRESALQKLELSPSLGGSFCVDGETFIGTSLSSTVPVLSKEWSNDTMGDAGEDMMQSRWRDDIQASFDSASTPMMASASSSDSTSGSSS